jgi:regulatory protein
MHTIKYTSRYELKTKLMRYGASLGYEFESVADVVDALISNIKE